MTSPWVDPAVRHRSYLERRYFGSLDGLRCVSIVAVIWHHTTTGWRSVPLTGNGFLGVDMFFVLSGFLIGTLLLREREQDGSISLSRFYTRRFLRIFPIYYSLVLAAGIAASLFKTDGVLASRFFTDLPFLLSYTTNWVPAGSFFGITWSLSTEEQFYLVWPPLQRIVRMGGALLLVGVFILLNQLVNFGFMDGALLAVGLDRAALPILQTTFTPICLGIITAQILHVRRGFDVLSGILGWKQSSLFVALALIVVCSVPGDLRGWPRLTMHVVMAALVASCVVREDHILSRLLSFPLVRRVGVISYGMYLYHLICGYIFGSLVGGVGENGLLRFVGTLSTTILVAELSYRFFEAPLLRVKERFRRPRPQWGDFTGRAIAR